MTAHTQNTCRFCSTPLEQNFCNLGFQPLSNSYIKPEANYRGEAFYPLHVEVCHSCFLVQLQEFESPEEIFSDYTYFSSYSTSWLKHCEAYAAAMTERLELTSASRVVEIASNDGYLLQYFKQRDIPVLGIEPAENVAEVARAKGIETQSRFFGVNTAQDLRNNGLRADLLLGNNVLAHVPDLNDFVAGMKILLADAGTITMEFPHLLRMMSENQFDTIYHEHFSYLSFYSVERVFAHHGLTMYDVEDLPTHGGSIRIYAQHQETGVRPLSPRLDAMRQREKDFGVNRLETYVSFEEKTRETKRALLEFLIEAKRTGKTIVGYGAPAKGNTLLNYCGVRQDFLDYTVDLSPHKQGCFLPGTHIPVFSPDKIAETKPDYILILPWNLKDEIMTQLAYVREWGTKFVIPIPRVEVID